MSVKPPKQSRSRFTFSTILEAALELINRREGMDRLTTRRIAERAGVSVGSLYQYFTNAESILSEALRARMHRDIADVETVFAAHRDDSLEDRFAATFEKLLSTHLPTGIARTALFGLAPKLGLVKFATNEVEGVTRRIYDELRSQGRIRNDLDEETTLYLVSRVVFGVTMSATVDHAQMVGREKRLAREMARLLSAYLVP